MKTFNDVAVFDLDGTVIRKNTFHLWVLYVFNNTNLLSKAKITSYYILRAVHIINHQQLKEKIVVLSQKNSSNLNVNIFCEHVIKKYANKNIIPKINKHNFNILATAAIDIYATQMSELLGFNECISTKTVKLPITENKSETKANEVFSFVKNTLDRKKIDYVFTDHSDDIPLIQSAEYSYLVSPNKKTLNLIKQLNIERYSVIE